MSYNRKYLKVGPKSPKQVTYKNIQSSINDLFTRNELIYGPSGRRRYLPYEEYIKIMKNKKEKGGIAFPQQPTAAEFFNAGFVPNMPFAFYVYGGSMFPDGGQWPKGLSKSLIHMLEPGSQELTPEQIMQLGYAQISGNEYSDPQGNTYFYKPMHMGTSSAGYSAGKSSGKKYSVVLKKGQKPSNALLQAYGTSNLDIYNKEYGGMPCFECGGKYPDGGQTDLKSLKSKVAQQKAAAEKFNKFKDDYVKLIAANAFKQINPLNAFSSPASQFVDKVADLYLLAMGVNPAYAEQLKKATLTGAYKNLGKATTPTSVWDFLPGVQSTEEEVSDFSKAAAAFGMSPEQVDAMMNDPYNFKKGGWIQAANKRMKAKGTKGSFTKYCGGKVTNECIQRGLNSSNPTTRKRAAFAKAMRSIRKEDGGETAPQNFGTDSILEKNKLTFMDYLKNNYESSLYDELENEYMMADGGAIDFNPMALSNAQMFDDAYNEMVDERDQNRRSFFDASMNMQQASRMMKQPQFAGNQQDLNIDPNVESYMNDYYKAMGEDQIPMAQYGLSFFPYNMAPYYKSKWKYKSASGDRMKGKSHYDPRFSSLSGFNYGAMSPDQMAALAQAYRNAGIDLKIETNPGLLGRVFKNIGPRKVTITAKSMGKPGSSQSLYEASKSPSKANLDRYYEDLNKAMYEEELRRNTEGLPARPDYQEPTSTSLLNIGSTPIDKQMFFKKKLEEDLNQFQQGGQDEFKMVQKRSPGFMSNPATAPWMLAGVDMLTNMFSADERRAAEEEAKKRKTFDYWTTANQSSQGDYLVDPYAGQSFRPNATGEKITPWGAGNFSQNIGNAYSAQFGGEMVDGEYELTDEQIEYIKARGGSVEYLD